MEVKIVRLVDLDAVIDCLEVEWGYEGIREDLYSLPVVDAVPIVHGKWGDNGISGSMLVKCSVCGFDCGANSFSYCPNCGAKMDGGKDNG